MLMQLNNVLSRRVSGFSGGGGGGT